MKSLILSAFLLSGSLLFAQQLPQKSSHVKVEQMVGLNKMTLEYSRPNVNDRNIFGELVPFGKVWRLGANAPTTLEIEHPITVQGKELKAGKYAVFAIPTEKNWKILFNTDHEQWGAYDYDAAKNVLAISVGVKSTPMKETMEITFDNVGEEGAELVARWQETEVRIPFTTNTSAVVKKNIEEAIKKGEDLGRVYHRAADYFNDHKDAKLAGEYLKKSLELERSYYNVFLAAQMKQQAGETKEAKKLAGEAKDLALKAEKQNWADYISGEMDEWK